MKFALKSLNSLVLAGLLATVGASAAMAPRPPRLLRLPPQLLPAAIGVITVTIA